jgi:hypothetical protein
MLQDCRDIVKLHTHVDWTALFGQLDVRTVSYLLQKGNKSIEGKSYDNLEEIKDKFMADAANVHGIPTAAYADEPRVGASSDTGVANATCVQVKHASYENLNDPMFQIQRAGFIMGSFITHKKDKDGNVFVVESMDNGIVKLREYNLFSKEHKHKDVAPVEIKENYRIKKAETLTVKLDIDWSKKWSYLSTAEPYIAAQKACIEQYLLELQGVYEIWWKHIQLYDKPKHARALCSIKKCDLVLVPFGRVLSPKTIPASCCDLGVYDIHGTKAHMIVPNSMVYPTAENAVTHVALTFG